MLKHVLVLFSQRYNYRTHTGIAAYAGRTMWHVTTLIRGDGRPLGDLSGVDGVLIADHFSDEVIAGLESSGLPVVSLTRLGLESSILAVVGDDAGIGTLAARHFSERAFPRCAYVGIPGRPASDLRRAFFEQVLAEQAIPLSDLSLAPVTADSPGGWRREAEQLMAQVAVLPKPCGIFCFNDILAVTVVDACLGLGLRVPDEVAILGVDDDPLFCETVAIPLSSIRHDHQRIALLGAERLDALMHRRPDAGGLHLVPPQGVTVRQSTDHVAVADPILAQALKFIANEHTRDIGLEDVARAVGRSRRFVQYLFRDQLGRTVTDETTRVRVEHAKTLLARTPTPFPAVALACGFASLAYFNRVFKVSVGCLPRQFRQERRAEPEVGRKAR